MVGTRLFTAGVGGANHENPASDTRSARPRPIYRVARAHADFPALAVVRSRLR